MKLIGLAVIVVEGKVNIDGGSDWVFNGKNLLESHQLVVYYIRLALIHIVCFVLKNFEIYHAFAYFNLNLSLSKLHGCQLYFSCSFQNCHKYPRA